MATAQLIASMMWFEYAPPPVNTSSARMFAPGATPALMPDTLVPWPLSSRLLSLAAKSCANATRQPVGTPGLVHAPRSARV